MSGPGEGTCCFTHPGKERELMILELSVMNFHQAEMPVFAHESFYRSLIKQKGNKRKKKRKTLLSMYYVSPYTAYSFNTKIPQLCFALGFFTGGVSWLLVRLCCSVT